MKCRSVTGAAKCDRCARKSLDCVFRQHRRGRRPLIKHETRRTVPDEQAPPQVENSTGPETHSTDQSTSKEPQNQEHSQDPASADAVTTKTVSWTGFWTDSEHFQPPDLLNKQATQGHFSLQNILSTASASVPASGTNTANRGFTQDPIQLGLVNHHIASSLFEG
jgi:hypothetical protein